MCFVSTLFNWQWCLILLDLFPTLFQPFHRVINKSKNKYLKAFWKSLKDIRISHFNVMISVEIGALLTKFTLSSSNSPHLSLASPQGNQVFRQSCWQGSPDEGAESARSWAVRWVKRGSLLRLSRDPAPSDSLDYVSPWRPHIWKLGIPIQSALMNKN